MTLFTLYTVHTVVLLTSTKLVLELAVMLSLAPLL